MFSIKNGNAAAASKPATSGRRLAKTTEDAPQQPFSSIYTRVQLRLMLEDTPRLSLKSKPSSLNKGKPEAEKQVLDATLELKEFRTLRLRALAKPNTMLSVSTLYGATVPKRVMMLLLGALCLTQVRAKRRHPQNAAQLMKRLDRAENRKGRRLGELGDKKKPDTQTTAERLYNFDLNLKDEAEKTATDVARIKAVEEARSLCGEPQKEKQCISLSPERGEQVVPAKQEAGAVELQTIGGERILGQSPPLTLGRGVHVDDTTKDIYMYNFGMFFLVIGGLATFSAIVLAFVTAFGNAELAPYSFGFLLGGIVVSLLSLLAMSKKIQNADLREGGTKNETRVALITWIATSAITATSTLIFGLKTAAAEADKAAAAAQKAADAAAATDVNGLDADVISLLHLGTVISMILCLACFICGLIWWVMIKQNLKCYKD